MQYRNMKSLTLSWSGSLFGSDARNTGLRVGTQPRWDTHTHSYTYSHLVAVYIRQTTYFFQEGWRKPENPLETMVVKGE